MDRAILLVNPRARRASGGVDAPVVRAVRHSLAKRWALDVVSPEGVADMRAQAARAAADGADVVFAGGGDGTAAAVARGLVGTATALGVIPLGTANDLARTLGVPREPLRAAERATRDGPRPMDVVAVDDDIFCTVGGLGIVTRSALAATRWKGGVGPGAAAARLLGGGVYRASAVATLLAPGAFSSTVEADITTPSGDRVRLALASPGMFVANGRHLGGGLTLPDVGGISDGVFELLVIQDVGRARLLDAFTRLTLRLPIPESVLRVVPARSAVLRCDVAATFLGDGEALGTRPRFELACLPAALRVLA